MKTKTKITASEQIGGGRGLRMCRLGRISCADSNTVRMILCCGGVRPDISIIYIIKY